MILQSFGDENYDFFYGRLDYKDKVVVDVGADWGSTAEWFLERGAAKVICIDNNVAYLNRIKQHFGADPRIGIYHLNMVSKQAWVNLITECRPDILKSDCEGGEDYLDGVSESVLAITGEYLIEVHSDWVAFSIMSKLRLARFFITRAETWSASVPSTWIIEAVRYDKFRQGNCWLPPDQRKGYGPEGPPEVRI